MLEEDSVCNLTLQSLTRTEASQRLVDALAGILAGREGLRFLLRGVAGLHPLLFMLVEVNESDDAKPDHDQDEYTDDR